MAITIIYVPISSIYYCIYNVNLSILSHHRLT